MIEFVNDIPFGESVGVCVFLIDKWSNGIYLAQRRGNYETGKFGAPGGMVEPNEDWISALIREVAEETDVRLKFPEIKFLTIAKHEGAKSNYTVWFKYYLSPSDVLINQEAMRLPLMLSTKETIINYL